MLKLVLKVRLQALLNSMFRFGESSRKSRIPKAFKITLLAILFAYVFVAVGFSVGIMFHSLGEVFIPVGLDWAYFVLVGLLALILGFVGSVFVTKTELFEARDNELLLSMPIRPVYILAGRILMLWMVELAYSLIIFVPTGIVYFIFSKANILSITAYLISCIAMSFLTLTLSCFFGWVFAMITRNMARKNLFTTVVMFVFFGLYIYAYANMSALITSIVEKGAALAEAIKKVLPPIYFFAKGASGDIIGLLLFLLCSLLPFAFVVWILSATFSKIVTKRTGLKAKSYSGGGLAVSDVRKALVKKELNRFFLASHIPF